MPALGDDAEILRWCRDVVSRVAALEPEMRTRTDDGLAALTNDFRGRLGRGEPLDDLLGEAFAAVREAAARTVGQRAFDVQIMGAAVLHLGKIAEMRTGEGKTLTATFPAYLHALSGAGVHVMTANDYLATRDAEWMGPVYRFLGLRVGLIKPTPQRDLPDRRTQYSADVTYGRWAEFGYDYLRDNLAWSTDEVVQRGHHFVIVDEADLILIDEMRSPLQISGPATLPFDPKAFQHAFAALAIRLKPGLDYETDPSTSTVSLTDSGARAVEDQLGIDDLYAKVNLPLVHYLHNALKAKEQYHRDHHYAVVDGKVVLIDQTSGRLHVVGHRYGEGIHEALEAKEGLEIGTAMQMLASVAMWDYLGQYEHLAGLTGTAQEDAESYRQIYQRDVVVIPTNRPMIRVDHADAIYHTTGSKLAALVDEANTRHGTRQPVLIGATSVAEARVISGLLTERGMEHGLLTALDFEQEAPMVAAAGGRSAVTVVAKMAGRGVDIVLGGADGVEREQVADLGGLCVLGAERPTKRRAEMHLRGRAGRQGDPGESKFFVSFEDELVKAVFGNSDKQLSLMRRMTREGDSFNRLTTGLTSAQAKQAANEAAWLVQMLQWDQVVADQQHLIYFERAPAARGEDVSDQVQRLIDAVIRAQVAAAEGLAADKIWRGLRDLYPVGLEPAEPEHGATLSRQQLARIADLAVEDAQRSYDRRETELGSDVIRELERRAIRGGLDQGLRQHLQDMSDLGTSITIRTSGPAALAEYRRDGTAMFNRMRQEVNRQIVRTVFHAKVNRADLGLPD